MTQSTLYVDLRDSRQRGRERFGVPADARSAGEAYRIICPLSCGLDAVSVIGFPRKRDAEMAKRALEAVGCVDEHTLGDVPFADRCRIMLEALQW